MPLDTLRAGGPERRIARLPDWESRLLMFLEQRRNTPRQWGAQDDIAFGIFAVAAMTGTLIRPVDWTDQAGAVRAMHLEGGLPAMWTRHLGDPLPDGRGANRGDLVLIVIPAPTPEWPTRAGASVAVCTGPLLAAVSRDGLALLPKDKDTMRAWRV